MLRCCATPCYVSSITASNGIVIIIHMYMGGPTLHHSRCLLFKSTRYLLTCHVQATTS
jgi:hypothetical protein